MSKTLEAIRFKEQLRRQLSFILASASAFDAGNHGEAVRIAGVIRTLLHDTRSMTSLMTHLGVKDSVRLTSTVARLDERLGRLVLFDGVSAMGIGGVRPVLGASSRAWQVSVKEWWDQVVLIEGDERHSRSSIIMTAADKDGGAHVDAKLTKEYESLMEGLWIHGRLDEGGLRPGVPVRDHQFIALRQFAYEIQNSPELAPLTQT